MTDYVRVGNRTLTADEMRFTTPKQIKEYEEQAEKANQKRLDNMRKSLGMDPKKVTLDVTPKGVAARKVAIAVEEAKIAAETNAIAEDLGLEKASFLAESEAPTETKKLKGKKAAEIAF